MNTPKRLGMLTPSSNTLLEPVSAKILSGVSEADCYFSRFPVTHISLEQSSLRQFDYDPMLRAAELLADAEVDVIAWNGASGSWMGPDIDRELCELITANTGIAATTATLAMLDAFDALDASTCHLVTPYIPEMNTLIAGQYLNSGFTAINVEGCALTVNKDIGSVSLETIESMFARVTDAPADVVSVPCTNFPVIENIEYLESKYGVVIVDSIAAVTWKSLKLAGVDPRAVHGWGQLFQLEQPV
ncbi:MAG: maleate isomerase [Microbacteriaceae bacterium]|nr:maleate isomerase [Microbacteriaceae bacterium]